MFYFVIHCCMNRCLLSVLGRISFILYCSLRKPECQFLDGLFLLPSLNQLPYNIIRCNQDRFLYYLSVYVKSFKELFLNLLVSGWFLKSECKSTNYFSTHQTFQRKSYCFNTNLTVVSAIFHFLPYLETWIALQLNRKIK